MRSDTVAQKMPDEALKLASDVMTFERPKKRPLKGARRIFAGGEKGNKMIRGAMERHLEDENDLCVLSAGSEPDRLTRLFEDRFAFMFRVSSLTFYN